MINGLLHLPDYRTLLQVIQVLSLKFRLAFPNITYEQSKTIKKKMFPKLCYQQIYQNSFFIEIGSLSIIPTENIFNQGKIIQEYLHYIKISCRP